MLASIRKQKGLSQSQLSELSGVSLRMIQKYEQADKDINKAQGQTIYLLAKALGCKMEDLIMIRYLLLIGNEVNFFRVREADTLAGIRKMQDEEYSDGYTTKIVDRTITTLDTENRLQYAVINKDGEQIDWINSNVDETE